MANRKNKSQKKYASIEALLADDFSQDAVLLKETKDHLQNHMLSNLLFSMRCNKGVTQKAVADKLGVTQGNVSKLEGKADKTIGVDELARYVNALGLAMEVRFYPQKNIANEIKYHLHRLKTLLKSLEKMAGEDEAMLIGTASLAIQIDDNLCKQIEPLINKVSKKADRSRKASNFRIAVDEEDYSSNSRRKSTQKV